MPLRQLPWPQSFLSNAFSIAAAGSFTRATSIAPRYTRNGRRLFGTLPSSANWNVSGSALSVMAIRVPRPPAPQRERKQVQQVNPHRVFRLHQAECQGIGGVTRASCPASRSEEHTSELQSRGLISYAVFCL